MPPVPKKATKKSAAKKTAKKQKKPQIIDIVIDALENGKAEDIVNIDIREKSSICDFMVIASGRSNTHVGAIAHQLSKALSESGYDKPRIEGLPHCDWVLLDGGDVIVHIFRPEVREFYNIEKMWSADFNDIDN